jgi:peptidoglycan/xylan/chitin deacetylase (PgdA/CDA1 family)
MPAKFILSLDCEGKWGVADRLTAVHRERLADDPLAAAYGQILGLLDQHNVPATFAFAGLFSQSAAQFNLMRPEVEAFAAQAPDFLRPALADVDSANGSGWHGAHLVQAVTHAKTPHEIALHGVTHVPWTDMDDTLAAAEMALFARLEGPVRSSRTFVFPRNLVAHETLLARAGIVGYRQAPKSRSRAASLAAEFNTLAKAEQPLASSGPLAIPGGFFPYNAPFQAGQPVTVTSSCNATSTWLAQSTNPPANPPAQRGERGR